MATFPELNSFGTLLGFAQALEETGVELAGLAGDAEPAAAMAGCAKKHEKRGKELQRLRRERLNEVVLQAIDGMERDEYLPPRELSADPAATMIQYEETAARFYDAAAAIAKNVLVGVDKKLKKMAKENRKLADALRA